jgi:hypothetical protein
MMEYEISWALAGKKVLAGNRSRKLILLNTASCKAAISRVVRLHGQVG